jgi:tetratricopeptide (TPR) repeat protein
MPSPPYHRAFPRPASFLYNSSRCRNSAPAAKAIVFVRENLIVAFIQPGNQKGISAEMEGRQMGQRLLAVILASVFAAASAFTASAQSDARVALLIANATYPDADAPLAPVLQDTRALADELRRNGFEVDVIENANKDSMRQAIDGFYGRIRSNSIAMIYFSGYGIQTGRQSYLIPVNAHIWTDPEVKRDGFSLDAILSEMNARGAGAKIAVIDASRRNPFERRFRGVSLGLATVILPRSSIVMYATGPGTVVADTDSKSSLFIGELLKEMRPPLVSVEEVFNRTRSGVARASRSEQVPWISSSLLPTEEVYFNRAGRPVSTAAATTSPGGTLSGVTEPAPAPKAAPTPAPAPATSSQETEARLDYELAERIGTRKSWDDFLVRHRNSSYADRAREQIARLEAPAPVPARPAPPPPAAAPSPAPRVTVAPPAVPVPPVAAPTPPPVATAPAAKAPPIPMPPAVAPKPSEPVIAALPPEERAMRELDRAIEQNPNDGDAYYKRGLALAQKGEYDRAIGDFDQAIRANPSDAEAFNNRCFVRAVLNELQRALQDCNESLRLRPNFIDALDSRGLVKLKIGAARDAVVDYDAALKINPRHAAALFGRGKAKQKLGDKRGSNSDIVAARGVQSDIAQEFEGYGVR